MSISGENMTDIKPISTEEDYRIACYFHDKLTEQFSHWKIKFLAEQLEKSNLRIAELEKQVAILTDRVEFL